MRVGSHNTKPMLAAGVSVIRTLLDIVYEEGGIPKEIMNFYSVRLCVNYQPIVGGWHFLVEPSFSII